MSEPQMKRSFALKQICRDLGLPEGDSFTQDWAYELGEEYRSECHLQRYIDAYNNPGYGSFERQLLVQLILDVINDLLQKNESVGTNAWNRTAEIIRENFSMHREQIEYWAVIGEALEDAFALTPLARELLASQSCTSG